MMLIWMTVKYHRICSSDVSILHEWAALSGIPVPYLSLPAYTPAGVLFNPNWTTGTISKLIKSLILALNFFMIGIVLIPGPVLFYFLLLLICWIPFASCVNCPHGPL